MSKAASSFTRHGKSRKRLKSILAAAHVLCIEELFKLKVLILVKELTQYWCGACFDCLSKAGCIVF